MSQLRKRELIGFRRCQGKDFGSGGIPTHICSCFLDGATTDRQRTSATTFDLAAWKLKEVFPPVRQLHANLQPHD